FLAFPLFIGISGLLPCSTTAKQDPGPDVVIQTFRNVGHHPTLLAFDGANIWTTNFYDGTVSKLRASDGTLLGRFNTAENTSSYPIGIAFDGTHIWVGNLGDYSLAELQASDGTLLRVVPLVSAPQGVAFDGANIWAVLSDANNVAKVRASDGAVLSYFPTGGD